MTVSIDPNQKISQWEQPPRPSAISVGPDGGMYSQFVSYSEISTVVALQASLVSVFKYATTSRSEFVVQDLLELPMIFFLTRRRLRRGK